MLKTHPIFRKTPPASLPKMPDQIVVEDLKAVADGETIKVSGTLKSPKTAHSALLADSQRNKFGDYWSRAYTSKIDEQGQFTVTVDETFESGTLYVGFAFNNGTNTGGHGKSFQGGSATTFSYKKTAEGIEIE